MSDEHIDILEELTEEIRRRTASMSARKAGQNSEPGTIDLPMSLYNVEVKAIGRFASVKVTQEFKNIYAEHLEAVYIFPISGSASVSAFRMIVDGRTIEGEIKERSQARQEYQESLELGHSASLLEQERDDVFTMQVGNIPPYETVRVELEYNEKLEFLGSGEIELRVPLVVAPRFSPGTELAREQVGEGVLLDTDIVPDASRISPPRLAAGLRANVSLGISVEILPDQELRDDHSLFVTGLSCSQFAVRQEMKHGAVTISLSKERELMNRDFVLRWKTKEKLSLPSIVFHRLPDSKDENSKRCYGMLSLSAPEESLKVELHRDVFFLLDCSGSMSGEKMVSAGKACSLLLSGLGPKDRFSLIRFESKSTCFESAEGKRVLPATTENIESGINYLRSIEAFGGTDMLPAFQMVKTLLAEITGEDTNNGRAPVVVLLTDGQVGNESNLLRYCQREMKEFRIFTIGVDTAINEAFLSKMSRLGAGTSTFVEPGDALEASMREIGKQIGVPALTDLHVRYRKPGGGGLEELAPSSIPDLFEGRAVDCFFTFESKSDNPIFVVEAKRADGTETEFIIPGTKRDFPALAQLWARERIRDLEDDYREQEHYHGSPTEQKSIKERIIELSCRYGVLTRFTAFMACDLQRVTNESGELRQFIQPVEGPSGWNSSAGWGAPSAGALPSASNNNSWGGPASGATGSSGQRFGGPIPGCAGFSNQSFGGLASNINSFGIDSSESFGGSFGGISDENMSAWQIPSSSGMWGGQHEDPEPEGFPSQWQEVNLHAVSLNGNSSEAWSRVKKLEKTGSKELEPAGAPLARIESALLLLRQSWSQFLGALGQCRIEGLSQLDSSRELLLDALSDHPIGFELPAMMLVLKKTIPTVCARVRTLSEQIEKSAAPQADFDKVLEQIACDQHEIICALSETERAVRKGRGKQVAFWESTV